jgi:hypothetical protein
LTDSEKFRILHDEYVRTGGAAISDDRLVELGATREEADAVADMIKGAMAMFDNPAGKPGERKLFDQARREYDRLSSADPRSN